MRPVKTSLTHPLATPSVAAGPTPGYGRIGIIMCPGKKQPQAVTGPWDRDLDLDMDVIKDFGATLLITLMETHELDAAVTAAELEAAANARGIAWLHLPIVDLSVPDAGFESAWTTEGEAIRRMLREGRNVMIHCRGGRGRSGLLAARLLVELGMDPEAAILAVRGANPLAIEMPVQEEHIRGLKNNLPPGRIP